MKELKRGEPPTAPPQPPCFHTDATDSYHDHRHRHVVFLIGSRYF
jgi:hypothetical protein